MATAIVTGSCGLVGSAVTELLIEKGMIVHGIDNDTRGTLFGKKGSIWSTRKYLIEKYGGMRYFHEDIDIRHEQDMYKIFATNPEDIKLIVHAAGQPSHDWSVQSPLADFDLNARATLLLLQCVRNACPGAAFVYLSTNKVYGDWINKVAPLREGLSRYHWPLRVRLSAVSYKGVTEKAPVDGSLHSPFGVSKLAGDLAVQEYGRYFGMQTVCFRCGCITGRAHHGVKLHGFLAYLAWCVRNGQSYTIFGHGGKQVRDNIHSTDLARAIWSFYQNPRVAAVYNMGGGPDNSCSILEAIEFLQELTGRRLSYGFSDEARIGDHVWWITDTAKFRDDYPSWRVGVTLGDIFEELAEV